MFSLLFVCLGVTLLQLWTEPLHVAVWKSSDGSHYGPVGTIRLILQALRAIVRVNRGCRLGKRMACDQPHYSNPMGILPDFETFLLILDIQKSWEGVRWLENQQRQNRSD